MSDPYGVTACSFVFDAGHDSVSDSHDGSSFRCGIIDSGMRLNLTGNRMLAGI